jgi:hypothetical protein
MSLNDPCAIAPDDLARIDAHAEYAALEATFENKDSPELERQQWQADRCGWIVLEVENRLNSGKLGEPIEIRAYLNVDGTTAFAVLGGYPAPSGSYETLSKLTAAMVRASSLMERYELGWKRHHEALP